MARPPNLFPTISLAVSGVQRVKKKLAVVTQLMSVAVVIRIENVLLNRVRDRFITKTDPRGRRWAPMKQSALERRARFMKTPKYRPTAFAVAHSGILVLNGTLQRSVSINRPGGVRGFATATGVGFRIGTNHPAARTHQFGDPKKNIPARPFLGMGLRDSFAVERILLSVARKLGLR